jgi:Fe-S-cluster-containing hydrogenase component 2
VVVVFPLQVSPQDCTGCELCVHVCPDDALTATPILDVLAPETAKWDFMQTIPNRGNLFDKSTVSGEAGLLRPETLDVFVQDAALQPPWRSCNEVSSDACAVLFKPLPPLCRCVAASSSSP